MTRLKSKTPTPFQHQETTSAYQDLVGNVQKRTFTFSSNYLYGVRDFSYLDRPVPVATDHPAHQQRHIFFQLEAISMEWRLEFQADIHPDFLIYQLTSDSEDEDPLEEWLDEDQLESWIEASFPAAQDAPVLSFNVDDALWLGVGTLFRLKDRYPKHELIAILQWYELAYQKKLSANFYQTLASVWEMPVDVILEKIAYGDLKFETNELDVFVSFLNGCPFPYLFDLLVSAS